VRPQAIRLKDTRSRWGSCAPDGTLAFSWRLVMAPDWVLDYVVAHEVAHLRELNHSSRFWAHVERLTPHRDAAVEWLRQHGPALLRVG
jgi:predicted metal-dependent hydrolase